MKNDKSECLTCPYLKCYDIRKVIYYCDHENRIDDMGKLSEDFPPEISPEWCPKRVKE